MEPIGASFGMAATNGNNKSKSPILQDLQNQYPHLNLSTRTFGNEAALQKYATNAQGKYNVSIDPRALERMESDKRFAEKIHGHLSGVKDAEDDFEKKCKERGNSLVSSGFHIDENGEATMWSYVTSTSTTGEHGTVATSKKSKEDLLAAILEKKKKEKEDLKKAQEKTDMDASLNIEA